MLSVLTKIIRKIFSFLYTNHIDTEEVLKNVSTIVTSKPETKVRTKDEILKDVDLESYQDEVYINEYDPNRKTILIMDDLPTTEVLYTVDFKNIKLEFGYDVDDKFNIIMLYDRKVGFAALKFFKKNIKIDYAILDINIDSLEKFDDGDYLDLDGIDIAIELVKINQDVKIIFSSAYTLNARNPLMYDYIVKYENNFNKSLVENTIDKNSIRFKVIHQFLRK